MKTVLILHGIGSDSNYAWLGWLKEKLVNEHIFNVVAPNLPNTDSPDRFEWLAEIQTAVKGINPQDLIIVGHSMGVPAGLDLVETLSTSIAGLISVSGFLQGNYEPNRHYMGQKTIDINNTKSKIGQMFVIYGDNDPYVPQEQLKELVNNYKDILKNVSVYKGGGHISRASGFMELPEVYEILMKSFV